MNGNAAVLAQHNTIQRKKRNVLSVLSDEANKKALENQVRLRQSNSNKWTIILSLTDIF